MSDFSAKELRGMIEVMEAMLTMMSTVKGFKAEQVTTAERNLLLIKKDLESRNPWAMYRAQQIFTVDTSNAEPYLVRGYAALSILMGVREGSLRTYLSRGNGRHYCTDRDGDATTIQRVPADTVPALQAKGLKFVETTKAELVAPVPRRARNSDPRNDRL